jgi:cyclomaltodextrinase / maltogenic alpha-amylase / neopullulanase
LAARSRFLLSICILLLCGGLKSGAARLNPAAVTLDTLGGEAWTFAKLVRGRTAQRACDQVWIHSNRGDVRALLQDQQYIARVPLQGGDNEIVAVCRSQGHEVARSHAQHWKVRLREVPHAWARTWVSGETVTLDGGATTPAPGIPAPLVRYEWRARQGNPAALMLASGAPLAGIQLGKRIAIRSPGIDGRYYVALRVIDGLGRSDEATAVFQVVDCALTEVDTQNDHAPWVDSAVLYGVALPLIGSNALATVTQRLQAIANLGATVVWLSPIAAAPDGDFGYASSDPLRLREEFGSDAQLRQLIATAHSLGLRVILDMVVNHLGDRSAYYADTQAHGAASPYYDWFERDARGRAEHYFDWINLENLNYDNPEVRTYLIAVLGSWLRDYSVDGFRIDAAWALRQRAPRLWPQVRRELESIDPDIGLLAEASALDPYYARHGFDVAYDWTPKPGEWAWQGVFGAPGTLPDLKVLRAALSRSTSSSSQLLTLHFLNNNDTGPRFVSLHGAGETRVAAALLFTIPGVPLIYDGDERGALYEPYKPGAATTGADDYGLTSLYTRLAHLRRELAALRSTQLTILHTDRDDRVLAYARGAVGAASALVVLLNFGATPVTVRVSLDGMLNGPGTWVATDLETGHPAGVAETQHAVQLPGYGALLLRHAARSAPPAQTRSDSHCTRGEP